MWHDPMTWTVVSIVVYALAMNLHWASHAARRRPQVFADVVQWCERPPRAALARGAYLFGVPALAVALRVAAPASLGLMRPRSALSVVGAVLVAALVVGLVAVSRRSLAGATKATWVRHEALDTRGRLGALLLTALLLEAHWALFRAGGLSAFGGVATPGVFFGLALLATESWSNPWRRIAFHDPGAVQDLTVGAAIAVMSAMSFLITGSSAVALALHIVVAIAIARLPVPIVDYGSTESDIARPDTGPADDPSAQAVEM